MRSAVNRWNQNTVDYLKKTYTHDINLNSQELEQQHIQKNKDNSIHGGGTLNIISNLSLGHGGLKFDDNQTYIVKGDNATYTGAGIDIGKNTTVDWYLKGVTNDNLHKIGAGTLDVKVSQGGNLKTGDGTVILSAERAFNNIYIASGNSTVKLNADNALGTGNYSGVFFTENGGTLDLNGHNQSFNFIAASDNGATITNTNTKNKSTLSINNTSDYIYHGNIKGNIDLSHLRENKQSNTRLILDGNIDTKNDIHVNNGTLVMQGHATSHATFRDSPVQCYVPNILCVTDSAAVIKKLEASANNKNKTGYMSNNAVSDFAQPDWEGRTFNFKTLYLDNADFSVARNAQVSGNIDAKNSTVTLGSDTAFIDFYSGKNITGNGFNFRQNVKSGSPTNTAAQDISSFTGNIDANNSEITINNKFRGYFSAENNSHVTVKNKDVILDGGARISNNSTLKLDKNASLTAHTWLMNSGTIEIGENAGLNLPGYPVADKFLPSVHELGNVKMTGDNATLTAANYTMFSGNITADDDIAAILNIGSSDEATLSDFNPNPELTDMMFKNYNASWTGSISASKGSATMNNAVWRMTGDSKLNSLNTNKSLTVFSSDNNSFATLTVNDMTMNDSTFVLRSNVTDSDKLIVKNKLDGKNNNLLVDFIENNGKEQTMNVELVTAPKGTSSDVFNPQEQNIGFSDVIPVIETENKDEKTTWTLKGFNVATNQQSVQKAENFMSAGYKNFLNEVNNLNKRMGDLRDINGEAGAWARIMSGAGSAGRGYSDNYTHVQIGADKKHELDGLDLFTGMTMTYTDSNAGNNDFLRQNEICRGWPLCLCHV